MELFFDTETSGFISKKLTLDDPKQAWIVQLGFILSDAKRIYAEGAFLIKPNGRSINSHAQAVHGISTEECIAGGLYEETVAYIFLELIECNPLIVCHNYAFDSNFMIQMILRSELDAALFTTKPYCCTMEASTDFCELPFKSSRRYGNQKYKWPKLEELHKSLFGYDFKGAHDALMDVRATRKCYYELVDIGGII